MENYILLSSYEDIAFKEDGFSVFRYRFEFLYSIEKKEFILSLISPFLHQKENEIKYAFVFPIENYKGLDGLVDFFLIQDPASINFELKVNNDPNLIIYSTFHFKTLIYDRILYDFIFVGYVKEAILDIIKKEQKEKIELPDFYNMIGAVKV